MFFIIIFIFFESLIILIIYSKKEYTYVDKFKKKKSTISRGLLFYHVIDSRTLKICLVRDF